MKIGDQVTFVDARRGEYPALLTQVWGQPTDEHPPVNLVYISADEAQQDPYGRQITRATSVVHETHQAAPGMFWR